MNVLKKILTVSLLSLNLNAVLSAHTMTEYLVDLNLNEVKDISKDQLAANMFHPGAQCAQILLHGMSIIKSEKYRILERSENHLLPVVLVFHDCGKDKGVAGHELRGFAHFMSDLIVLDRSFWSCEKQDVFEYLKEYFLRDITDKTPEQQEAKAKLKRELKIESYQFKSGEYLNIVQLLRNLGLSIEEIKEVAVLVAAHKMFTEIYAVDLNLKKALGNLEPITIDQFKDILNKLCFLAGIDNSIINKDFLNMLFVLTYASVRGVFFAGPQYISFVGCFAELNHLPQILLQPRRNFDGVAEKYDFGTGPCSEEDRRYWYGSTIMSIAPAYEDQIFAAYGITR
ncbi:TPA: hypothetical protein DEO28_00260 [Candidatus Dependentiae bacterium]|nr:MAG: hypothetical protein UR14_C0001G0091 [candidate division TM6 bacterium GW2011_GWE2_31_21]KKP54029.1 MAG: hypothetical protein UR43_C0001G0047 [candidate division TM6 bacterium GW2011_GWF2_33_332]HBS48389.1 hypothetical protein [Candidatus Dependentiae bacterium]HBZ72937.1 hypothetical protein [Candidatus Dependentiae bacterium]